MPTHTVFSADLSLRYTLHVAGTLSNYEINKQSVGMYQSLSTIHRHKSASVPKPRQEPIPEKTEGTDTK